MTRGLRPDCSAPERILSSDVWLMDARGSLRSASPRSQEFLKGKASVHGFPIQQIEYDSLPEESHHPSPVVQWWQLGAPIEIGRYACSFAATDAVGVSRSAKSRSTSPCRRRRPRVAVTTTSAAPDAGQSTRCLWGNWRSPFLDRRPQRRSSTRRVRRAVSHQLSAIRARTSAR